MRVGEEKQSGNMKHPLGASAKTRGPSALGPGLSGSREYDVASLSWYQRRSQPTMNCISQWS